MTSSDDSIIPQVYPIDKMADIHFRWLLRECPSDLMSWNEFSVLHAMRSRKGTEWDSIRPSQEQLAEDTKTSVSSVKRAVKTLIAKGWIEVLEPGTYRGANPKATVYGIRGVPVEVCQALSEKLPRTPGNEWFHSWVTQTHVHGSHRPMIMGHTDPRAWVTETYQERNKESKLASNGDSKAIFAEENDKPASKSLSQSKSLPPGNAATLPALGTENKTTVSKTSLPQDKDLTPVGTATQYAQELEDMGLPSTGFTPPASTVELSVLEEQKQLVDTYPFPANDFDFRMKPTPLAVTAAPRKKLTPKPANYYDEENRKIEEQMRKDYS
jgi:hypothetical protein